MMRRVFILDTSKCFGCLGCVAACVHANRTPSGVLWREVLKLPPEEGSRDTLYLSLACNHCENAPCVRACPSGALSKRSTDGVVLHDPDQCLGCRYCQMACPYGAIRYDASTKVTSKCQFCADRIDEGREPACVETCFGGALRMEIVDSEAEPAEYRKEIPGFVHHPEAGPGIRFLRK